MVTLPFEIIREIIEIFLADGTSSPVPLLSCCSAFGDVARPILYTKLQFKTRSQLASFVATFSKIQAPSLPQSLALDITGGAQTNLVFSDLFGLFNECYLRKGATLLRGDDTLYLDTVYLRMNSHAYNPVIDMVFTSLSLINCRIFTWIGPDPPHHFSIAIVPRALKNLLYAISNYPKLTELKLTHLTMTGTKQLPPIPSLVKLHLGQVVFLHPITVASFVLAKSMTSLEEVKLVDAYTESIWGPRLRRSPIETAAAMIVEQDNLSFIDEVNDARRGGHLEGLPELDDVDASTAQSMIIKKVICVIQTERIIGGDRGGDTTWSI